MRDALFGRVVTYSPKVFLPLTNLCRNHCDYCSFRRSPGDAGRVDDDARGDRSAARAPRGSSAAPRRSSASATSRRRRSRRTAARSPRSGQASTVEYLHWAGVEGARRTGSCPHTNAGLLTDADMTRLKEVNVSLGLMLECASPRLCEPGMPHHRAPDKRPDRRLAMIDAAGRLRIPFTTGILVGIGETRRERVESLLAIRERSPRARPHPGGHRAELPRRARRADEPRARARRRRGDARRGDGAPHPRRRRLAAGAAQPEPRVGRGAPRVGAQRLRRHLAGHARLHQPAPPLAAHRRAGRRLRARRLRAASARVHLRSLRRAARAFSIRASLAPTRDVQARLAAQGGPS